MTWGEIYRQHLVKGEDHGSAAYSADQWQKREDQRFERLRTQQIERDVLKKHGLLLSHTEETCPGHVAAAHDGKICGNCGIHIDSLR